MNFCNRRFLITGGSSGIGARVALDLNARGAEVVIIGRDNDKMCDLKEHADCKDRFIFFKYDLNEINGLDKLSLQLAKQYGVFDGAVLSAGIQHILPISSPDFLNKNLDLFRINYFANLQIIRGLLDKRAKCNVGSSFVWISSNSSVKASKGLIGYSSSKGAVNIAVKSIALEIAPKYRINAVSPGFVVTEMVKNWSSVYDDEFLENIKHDYPLGIGKAEYVSDLVLFLLSERSRWITGQNLIIDGGASL